MRNMDSAKGPPKERGRLVTRMKIGPLFLSVYALADSEADVEEAGYSPPVPNPVIPRATVNIQNMPEIEVPFAPALKARPTMIIVVVMTIAVFRPR